MRTLSLSFDADKMGVDSSNGKFTVNVEADERDLGAILNQIGIKNIIIELKDKILDEVGSDYCAEYFDLIPNPDE